MYLAPELNDSEYCRNYRWEELTAGLSVKLQPSLHLATSVRSFRTPSLAALVKALLDLDIEHAKLLYSEVKEKYPIVITRDLNNAKHWIREQCKGTTRYGLIASSKGLRLKPEGIFVKNDISVAHWFLNAKDDVRSSFALEDVATEFDIQGLELDYSLVAWDADFRFNGNNWTYHSFVGTKWITLSAEDRCLYLKNAYRVLLTRARQGMVIFIPQGSDCDASRKKDYYSNTYILLKSIGLQEI